MEKRNYLRFNINIYADLEFVDQSYENCEVENLSMAGILVKGNFENQKGKCCRVNIIHKGMGTNFELQVQTRVLRNSENEIALEFASMTYDSYMFLNILLLNHADKLFTSKVLLAEDCPFELKNDLPACTI